MNHYTLEQMLSTAGVDVSQVPSPCFVVNFELLEKNLKKLHEVQKRTGAKVLLALKGYAYTPSATLISKYLSGTTSSGLHELLLAEEFFQGERHVFSPSFDERNFEEICTRADHLVFNTPSQWQRFKPFVEKSGRKIHCGIRVNPGYSEIEVEMYNPCAQNSRLGTPLEEFKPGLLKGIEVLHFHTMCEQGSETLARTLPYIEKHFGDFIRKQCHTVNFGGGHHITREDYNFELLIETINQFKQKYNVDVILEPGEAIGLNAGVLVSRVLDIQKNGMNLAILDTSASAHMPDVLEMPYKPKIVGAGEPGEFPFTYRLGGLTCLSGDVIGDYSFPYELTPGTELIFLDMAHYSMVKTNTFNGVPLATLAWSDPRQEIFQITKRFDYEDFKVRLG